MPHTELNLGLLTKTSRDALSAICVAVRDTKVRVFLVGGGVRDLLIGHSPFDLDICVVGLSTVEFCTLLNAYDSEFKLVMHTKFLTAKIRYKSCIIDVANARSEVYEKPAGFPKVRTTDTIEKDLRRRDFSINAISFDLISKSIVDPYGGVLDVKKGVINTLHKGSFRDDPSRIFRAIRYKTKLNFKLSEKTHIELRDNLRYISYLTGVKIYREYDHILRLSNRVLGLTMCQELGVNKAICQSFRLSPKALSALSLAKKHETSKKLWETLISYLDDDEVFSQKRIDPPKRIKKLLQDSTKRTKSGLS